MGYKKDLQKVIGEIYTTDAFKRVPSRNTRLIIKSWIDDQIPNYSIVDCSRGEALGLIIALPKHRLPHLRRQMLKRGWYIHEQYSTILRNDRGFGGDMNYLVVGKMNKIENEVINKKDEISEKKFVETGTMIEETVKPQKSGWF